MPLSGAPAGGPPSAVRRGRVALAAGLVAVLLALFGALLLALPRLDLVLIVLAAVSVGIPIAWLIWRQPVVILALLLVLNASFIPSSALDVRLGFGGLDLTDLLLLGLIGVMAFRAFLERRLYLPWWPVSGLLLLYLGFALFSTVYAVAYRNTALNFVFTELRPIIYLLSFFAVAWSVTRARDLIFLLAVLFAIADLVAVIIIVQQFLGLHNPLLGSVMEGGGRTWLLWPVAGRSSGFGSVRVIPAAHVLTYVMSVVAFTCLLQTGRSFLWRAFFAAQVVFLTVGLVLTYTRAEWIASAVAITLALIVTTFVLRHRTVAYVLIGVFALLVGLSLVGASPLSQTAGLASSDNPLMSRFLTIFNPDETLDTSSLQWRVFENGEGAASIADTPIFGVGLGGEYRSATLLRQRETVGNLRFARFIHNAYLYIAIKMGLPALAVFLWFCLAFLASGWRGYLRMPEGVWKPVTLAMLVSFVGLLLWSNTQPNFMLMEATLFIGAMGGVVAASRRLALGDTGEGAYG